VAPAATAVEILLNQQVSKRKVIIIALQRQQQKLIIFRIKKFAFNGMTEDVFTP
jgi:hypothetical protein